MRVVATAVVGITVGETVVGFIQSELLSSEDPDKERVVATAVVGITEGETVVGLTEPELESREDPGTGRVVATAVVGITVSGTSVEVFGSGPVSGEGFRKNSEISTAPAASNTTARRATPARIYLFIREG